MTSACRRKELGGPMSFDKRAASIAWTGSLPMQSKATRIDRKIPTNMTAMQRPRSIRKAWCLGRMANRISFMDSILLSPGADIPFQMPFMHLQSGLPRLDKNEWVQRRLFYSNCQNHSTLRLHRIARPARLPPRCRRTGSRRMDPTTLNICIIPSSCFAHPTK